MGSGCRCAFSKHYPPENYVIGHYGIALSSWRPGSLRWLSAVRTRLRQRLDLLLEFIVLRHQLAVLQRTGARRPCFRPSERLFWVLVSRCWANWQRSLIIVQPATVLHWRRRGFCVIWVSGSCGRWRGGHPKIGSEVRALIVQMQAFSTFARSSLSRTGQANYNSYKAVLHVCQEQPAQELMILYAPPLPGARSASRPSWTRS